MLFQCYIGFHKSFLLLIESSPIFSYLSFNKSISYTLSNGLTVAEFLLDA